MKFVDEYHFESIVVVFDVASSEEPYPSKPTVEGEQEEEGGYFY